MICSQPSARRYPLSLRLRKQLLNISGVLESWSRSGVADERDEGSSVAAELRGILQLR